MGAPDGNGETRDDALRIWLRFWLQLLVLGAVAGFGFAFAAADRDPGNYAVGVGLAIAAIALGYVRLRLALDGEAQGCGEVILVDDMASLAFVIPLFAVIGLAGILLAAAWKSGSPYGAGLALFAASAIIIFLNIKHVFDRIDSRHR